MAAPPLSLSSAGEAPAAMGATRPLSLLDGSHPLPRRTFITILILITNNQSYHPQPAAPHRQGGFLSLGLPHPHPVAALAMLEAACLMNPYIIPSVNSQITTVSLPAAVPLEALEHLTGILEMPTWEIWLLHHQILFQGHQIGPLQERDMCTPGSSHILILWGIQENRQQTLTDLHFTEILVVPIPLYPKLDQGVSSAGRSLIVEPPFKTFL